MSATVPDSSVTIGPQHKSIPPRLWGSTIAEAGTQGIRLTDLATPVLVIDEAALQHNTGTMQRWMAARGVSWAPHGKTTMSPELWARALDAGAWGITVATGWQALVARAAGVERILVANEIIDPVALDALAETAPDVIFFVDSVEATTRASTAARRAGARLGVIVDLGGAGGRAGVRGGDEAFALASAVANDPHLELRGVGGYEGALAHDRKSASIDAVRSWTGQLTRVFEKAVAAGLFAADEAPIVTASGSLYFDVVAAELAPLVGEATVLLRPGAVQTHDSGFYRELSPLVGTDEELHPAIHVWSHVLARPEPGLAILDAGRRDVPYDQHLPVIDQVGAERVSPLLVTAVDDQHAYVRADVELPLAVGDRVRLALSHPCTAFDKWRLIPIVADGSSPDAAVVDFVTTIF
ncbi:amino acid deaminase [Labedella phragmitis]|uniref:Amino acid deaminase n=1 Tax=Labedella phragmitis TaxID=2498849 RepID=A0A3S4AJG4_9MICO|nr:alanine racemase [Labedella phragmitis]RWZ49904.1 amino acid deaminase [Labedella phragmitis]